MLFIYLFLIWSHSSSTASFIVVSCHYLLNLIHLSQQQVTLQRGVCYYLLLHKVRCSIDGAAFNFHYQYLCPYLCYYRCRCILLPSLTYPLSHPSVYHYCWSEVRSCGGWRYVNIMFLTQHSFLLYYWYDTNILVCHAASPPLLLLTYIAGSGDLEAEVRIISFVIFDYLSHIIHIISSLTLFRLHIIPPPLHSTTTMTATTTTAATTSAAAITTTIVTTAANNNWGGGKGENDDDDDNNSTAFSLHGCCRHCCYRRHYYYYR